MIPGGLISSVQQSKPGTSTSEELVKNFEIQLVGDTYLIWDVDVILYLREKLGIVGTPAGTLARKPRQNKICGPPLAIMKEEAYLLQLSGLASIETLKGLPSSKCDDAYFHKLKKSYEEQNRYLMKEIYRVSKKFVEKPVDVPPHLDLTSKIDVKKPPYHSQRIFHKQSAEFWDCDFEKLSGIEMTATEKRRVVVLQDLHRRKYMVTSGSKFGGDFLAYPGDPLVYHAYFVVKVCSRDQELQADELLGFSRVASSVKKVAVLASVDGSNVTYTSLQWSGLS